MSSYDSPWKEAFDHRLRLLLRLLFPKTEALINWSEDYESLEQELRQIAGEGELGVRLADKLLKVRTMTGDERILHAEVQAQRRQEFERRAFVYHYRAHDRFGIPPEALVILADDDPGWKPTRYEYQHHYTKMTFEFQPVKLLEWADRKEELLEHENLMGLFVLAHLEAQRTQNDVEERARVKLDLLLVLAGRKLDEDETLEWYRYLDWFLDLPDEKVNQVYSQVSAITKEKGMPFVTLAERQGREEGIKEGKKEGIKEGTKGGLLQGRRESLALALRLKFGAEGTTLLPAFESIDDEVRLASIVASVEQAASLDEVRKHIPPAASTQQASE
jgi:hypothetical protein